MSTTTIALQKPEPVDQLKKRQEPPDLVVYEIGVLLDAQDFKDEQLYHRGRLARALSYLEGPGTVSGLLVEWQSPLAPDADADFPDGREEEIVVQPGLAIDRLGRQIELPSSACIRLGNWYNGQSPDALIAALHGAPFNGVVADVFIRFFLCERGKTPAFAVGPFDALDAVQPSRLREFYKLELVLRDEENLALTLPENRWSELAGIADVNARRARLHQLIFNSWREGKDGPHPGWDKDGPLPRREHVTGQDPTSLFLARVTIPAHAAGDPEARPIRDAGVVVVSNELREFVYSPAALAGWIGI